MAGKLKWFGREVVAKIDAKQETALTKGSIMIINKAKELMREPKTGEDYRGKGKKGKKSTSQFKTRSSAPGEAPAVQTGRLRASLAFEQPKKLTRLIGSNLKKAFFLEKGTAKMKARPFLRPAYRRTRARIARLLRGAI